MLRNKDFLTLLANAGDCINPEKDVKPLRLQTACGIVLLHSAISATNEKDVSNLLKLGISVDSRVSKKDNKTALQRAVESGNGRIVNLLISFGANVNENCSFGSLLDYAVGKGLADVVEVLLSAGMDVNKKDEGRLPLLYRAADQDDFDTAEILYDYGAEICTDSGTPLVHLAVARNSSNAICCFADLNLELDVLDQFSYTPLYMAAKLGNLNMVKVLIENGANLYERDSEGNSYLHTAVKESCLTAIKILLDVGMDVDVPGGWWNWTPLHVAASNNSISVAEFLIGRKASVNIKTSDDKTALDIAKEKSSISVMNFLQAQ